MTRAGISEGIPGDGRLRQYEEQLAHIEQAQAETRAFVAQMSKLMDETLKLRARIRPTPTWIPIVAVVSGLAAQLISLVAIARTCG